jgi:hypothetical protein
VPLNSAVSHDAQQGLFDATFARPGGGGAGERSGVEVADAVEWDRLSATLPVRYSPHIGVVFENPQASSVGAIPWWSAQPGAADGCGMGTGHEMQGAVVKAVVDNGPLARRMLSTSYDSIQPGDVLVDIDGQRVNASKPLALVLEMLAGDEGSPVTLIFRRYASDTSFASHIAQHVVTVFRASSASPPNKSSASTSVSASAFDYAAGRWAAGADRGQQQHVFVPALAPIPAPILVQADLPDRLCASIYHSIQYSKY